MVKRIILTVEAAMHIFCDVPCLLICREKLLEMSYTEYNVSEPSLETSKTEHVRPTFGRWTSVK